MASKKDKVQRASGEPSFFSMIPHMADDDLDVYEYRLYGHYKRVGTCWESVRTTAKGAKMSTGKVVDARDSLKDKGYITITESDKGTYLITLVNRWDENHARYSKERSPHEQGCSPHEQGCSPHEPKNTNNKNTQEESGDGPSQVDVFGVVMEQSFGYPIGTKLPKGVAGRIGKVVKELRANTQELTVDDLQTFYQAWDSTLDKPRDGVTLAMHFTQWQTEASKPAAAPPDVPTDEDIFFGGAS